MTIRIGTSGWSYDDWRGVLYPPKTPASARLARYAEEFDTVELNASFYRWPKDDTFEAWRRQLPPGFTMSVKAQRGLTHFRRLRSPEPWIDHFLGLLPAKIRVAVELRHPSWDDPDVYELLERRRAAYVVMSGAGLACIPRVTTDIAYVRMHRPDSESLYAGSYSTRQLHTWADRIVQWDADGCDVFVYFNNDGSGHAVRNARKLKQLLDL